MTESYIFKILHSANKLFFYFFGHVFSLNVIRPKIKICDSAKRILCLTTPMEKAGKHANVCQLPLLKWPTEKERKSLGDEKTRTEHQN